MQLKTNLVLPKFNSLCQMFLSDRTKPLQMIYSKEEKSRDISYSKTSSAEEGKELESSEKYYVVELVNTLVGMTQKVDNRDSVK